MNPPAAALAVLRAALVDARLEHPDDEAQAVVDALARDGWTLAPVEVDNARETPAHAFVTNG
ncbi:hypothetical protein RI578_22840 [Streptomyces sp. BB1-1-1]|uniref:hypothetical protein n=1 Tax=Streptomyces sp. BB1-1-1 TaxID=3074430 RepID=UPI002877F17B|nr:hypothetical protein [Streptomyces sp. BB1-1-1]WND36948.1 hypothetical protein RI578_22840 [Streptomyces sp. BB1-1-1]